MKKLPHQVWNWVQNFRWIIVISMITYLLVAALDVYFQVWNSPRTQATTLSMDSGIDLHILTPQTLTFDGQRHQGRITLSIKSRENFNPISPPLFAGTKSLAPENQLDSSSVISTPDVDNDPFMNFCSGIIDMPSILTIAPDTPVISPDDEGDERLNELIGEEKSFLITGTEGILFITSDGISFTPIITLSLTSNITEASFIVEHAVMANTPPSASMSLVSLDNQQFYPNVTKIDLEVIQSFYRRKFIEIALALGSFFPLLAAFLGYLYQEQAEREQKRKAQEAKREQEQQNLEVYLKQISDQIKNAPVEEVLPLIQPWTNLASSLTKPTTELHIQVRAVREAIQKVVTGDVKVLADPDSGWIAEAHAVVQNFKGSLAKEDIQIIDDLFFVAKDLSLSQTNRLEKLEHTFVDAYLHGVYLNAAWSRLANEVKQNVLCDVSSDTQIEVLQQILWGIYTCDEQITMADSFSLRKELGEWYILQDIPEDRRSSLRVPAPCSEFFGVIDSIAGKRIEDSGTELNPGLLEWCSNLQKDRRSMAARFKTQVRVRNSLWPISETTQDGDANYDYKYAHYDANASKQWDEIINKLNVDGHQYVAAGKGSGKSWLRIRFEKMFEDPDWPDHATILPVFYFPPVELLYKIGNRNFLYQSFARSIANCLVAVLLESYAFEEWEIQQISPFLSQYDYEVPLGAASLASPTPAGADLDSFYGNKAQNYRLGQIREAIHQAKRRYPQPGKAAASQILRDVQIVVNTAGFERVYLLVDNLQSKNLQLKQEERIWSVLRSAEVGVELQRHHIYLKMFGISPGEVEGWIKSETISNPITGADLHIFRLNRS